MARLGGDLLGLVLAWDVAQGALLQFSPNAPGAGTGGAVFLAGVGLSLAVHAASQRIGGRRPGPAGDLAIGAIGPIVHLLLAALVVLLARMAYLLGAADALVRSMAALATFNVVMAAINLLPARPFDGARVLQAILQALGRDPQRAARDLGAVTETAALLVLAGGLVSAVAVGLSDAFSWIIIGVILLAEGRAARA